MAVLSFFTYIVVCSLVFFFFKQKTAYEMRISDWSSDVCSSDLRGRHDGTFQREMWWWQAQLDAFEVVRGTCRTRGSPCTSMFSQGAHASRSPTTSSPGMRRASPCGPHQRRHRPAPQASAAHHAVRGGQHAKAGVDTFPA